MQKAIHSRFFGCVYRYPKQRDIFSGIKICINSIYFTICVGAFKHLIGSFPNVFTAMAGLTRIPWVNCYNFHTIKQPLVFNVLSKHREIPFTKFSPKLLISSFTCKSNSGKVFNGNSLTLLFGRLNNRFCNRVINYGSVSLFFARKPFQKFSRTSCAFALNRTPNPLPMFTIFVKSISRMLNTIRSYNYIIQAKVATNKFLNILNIFFGNINGLKKVKLAFFINQISFPFDVRNIVRIMANKVNFLSATDTPQGNNIVSFISHYPTIISNATKWSKSAFGFLIQLISIGNFGYLPNKHLGRKVKRSFVRMICAMVQFKIIENLLLPSNVRNGITNSVGFLHRIEKQVSLFIGRQKFYFQCEFHDTNIQIIFLYRKIITNFVKQFNYGAAIPPIGSRADQWVS